MVLCASFLNCSFLKFIVCLSFFYVRAVQMKINLESCRKLKPCFGDFVLTLLHQLYCKTSHIRNQSIKCSDLFVKSFSVNLMMSQLGLLSISEEAINVDALLEH